MRDSDLQSLLDLGTASKEVIDPTAVVQQEIQQGLGITALKLSLSSVLIQLLLLYGFALVSISVTSICGFLCFCPLSPEIPWSPKPWPEASLPHLSSHVPLSWVFCAFFFPESWPCLCVYVGVFISNALLYLQWGSEINPWGSRAGKAAQWAWEKALW